MASGLRYPEYKTSRDSWLGKLPAHWREVPIKRLARVDNSGAYGDEPETQEVNLPVATTAQISADGKFDVGRMPIRSFSGAEVRRYGCNPDDILIVKSSGSAANIISGKAGLVDTDTPSFIYSNFLMRLVPDRAEVHPRFLYALIVSSVTRERVQRMVSTTTYPNLQVGEYVNALAPCPSLEEQTQIAKFLDRETAKIDALIEKQQQLIALLEEKRQAVISHAVTKGLNPDAPMRDSGIEWLGEVPAHWVVGRYKFCTTRVVVGIAEAATHAYADEGVPIIRSTNIKDDHLSQDGLLFIKREFAEQNTSKYLYTNDIVTVRTGYPGISAIVPKTLNKSQCFTNLIATPNSECDPRFLCEFLNSHLGRTYFDLLGWGSAQKNISVPILQNIPIVYPGRKEQVQIADHIAQQREKFAPLVARALGMVDVLQERRTALISAAVTGKIDVRGWKAPESEVKAELA